MAVARQPINDILPEEYQKAKACIKVILHKEEINVGVNNYLADRIKLEG
jgi:hypothetical protein